ncbi:porin [Tabrizicola sp.]|uniref:porin n=1 Tax=Tabrizicola sp. TaxID=2005166 RepID=UPI003D2B6ABB
MKKVLLATSALALSAGVAYAEVSISGDARMGLQYDSTTGDTRIEKRMNVNVRGTVETSSGLTFGAHTRMRSNEAGGPTGFNGARVYMQVAGFEVAMGNIYGAIDSMPNLYHSELGLTYLGAGDVATVSYDGYSSNGNGAEGVEVMYSAGAFSGHVSYSEPTLSSGASTAKRAAVHVAYTMNDWTVALGHQKSSVAAEKLTVVTVAGNIGDYGVGFSAADNAGVTKITLAGSATFGATGVQAFVSDEEGAADMAFGLGVSYDLGGAEVRAGVQRDQVGETQADLGVAFKF